jgi:hypothetical protein
LQGRRTRRSWGCTSGGAAAASAGRRRLSGGPLSGGRAKSSSQQCLPGICGEISVGGQGPPRRLHNPCGFVRRQCSTTAPMFKPQKSARSALGAPPSLLLEPARRAAAPGARPRSQPCTWRAAGRSAYTRAPAPRPPPGRLAAAAGPLEPDGWIERQQPPQERHPAHHDGEGPRPLRRHNAHPPIFLRRPAS